MNQARRENDVVVASGDDRPITRREFDEYKKVTQRELDLQAKEYERRLTDLNGEAGRLAKFMHSTVSQESFGDYKKLIDERVDALRKAEDQRTGGLILLRVLAVSGSFGLLLSLLNSFGIKFGT
jgi:hypothetical protein